MSKNPTSGRSRNRVQHFTVDLYQGVIDDTVSRVKGEFVQEGIDESVLDELRALWEQALEKTGVCEVPEPTPEPEEPQQVVVELDRSNLHESKLPSSLPGQQGAGPAAATIPTAQLAQGLPPQQLPPGFTQQQQQQLLLQQQQYMQDFMKQMAAGASVPNMQQGTWPRPLAIGAQPVPPPMQAAPTLPGAPDLVVPPPLAAQQPPMVGQKRSLDEGLGEVNPAPQKQLNLGAPAAHIPQQDGPADDSAPAPDSAAAAGGAGGEEEAIGPGDSGDELNEDDDLADVDDHEEINEEAITDVILGQFEKVHRSKQKWKVNLKNCVATINGRDYLLKKVTGEMNFS